MKHRNIYKIFVSFVASVVKHGATWLIKPARYRMFGQGVIRDGVWDGMRVLRQRQVPVFVRAIHKEPADADKVYHGRASGAECAPLAIIAHGRRRHKDRHIAYVRDLSSELMSRSAASNLLSSYSSPEQMRPNNRPRRSMGVIERITQHIVSIRPGQFGLNSAFKTS